MLFGVGCKIMALVNNGLGGIRGHKTSGSRFFFLVGADLGKIAWNISQQFQIIRNILLIVKCIFCQQDRKLGLQTGGRCQWLVITVEIRTGFGLCQMIIEDIQRQLVFCGKLFRIKLLQRGENIFGKGGSFFRGI